MTQTQHAFGKNRFGLFSWMVFAPTAFGGIASEALAQAVGIRDPKKLENLATAGGLSGAFMGAAISLPLTVGTNMALDYLESEAALNSNRALIRVVSRFATSDHFQRVLREAVRYTEL